MKKKITTTQSDLLPGDFTGATLETLDTCVIEDTIFPDTSIQFLGLYSNRT